MDVEFGRAWDGSTVRPGGEKTGWFVGNFAGLPDGSPRRHPFYQVKWYEHPGGQASPPGKEDEVSEGVTVSVLVSGRFTVWCRDPEGPWAGFTLERPGDYLTWGANVQHRWQASPGGAVVLTVRPGISETVP